MPYLRPCVAMGCHRMTSSITGYCSGSDRCRDMRKQAVKERRGAGKASTEIKAARGQSPEPGSIPGSSTEIEALRDELDVAYESMQDLLESNERLHAEIQRLRDKVFPPRQPGHARP